VAGENKGGVRTVAKEIFVGLERHRQIAHAPLLNSSVACYILVGYSSREQRRTVQVTLQLPDEVAQGLGIEADIPRRVKEAVALEGYRAGRLSRGQVSQLLGQTFSETEAFLKENDAVLRYSKADLEADLAALDKILANR